MTTGDQPNEEELRAAYEAELKKIRVEQIVLEQIVSLVNLGMRRTGLAPGTEDERDPDQVRVAIEAVRALLPVIEPSAPSQVGAIRDALSQLQMAYVRIGGQTEAGAGAGAAPGAQTPPPPAGQTPGGAGPVPGEPEPGPPGPGGVGSDPAKPGEPGPAQRSGRLWIPGQ
jgi:hypothetical protein